MANTKSGRPSRGSQEGVEASVDLALRRLTESGYDFLPSLEKMHDNLTQAIQLIQSAGFGDTSFMRRQLMVVDVRMFEYRQGEIEEKAYQDVG